jgi:LacI family transcriptional regulator
MGTMADVARAAGVSVSTVSHVVNNTRMVRPDTRDKVLRAIEATGFRRNVLATALVTSKTHSIGLSISALRNPYFASLVHSIEERASARGYTLVMGDSHDTADVEEQLINSLLDRQVDGLIIAPAPGSERRALANVLARSTPMVLIDRHADVDCDQIAPDNVEPAKTITAHLLALGHRRLAVVAGMPGLQSTTERVEGVREAIRNAGLGTRDVDFLQGNSRQEDAYREVRRLFEQPGPAPAALVVLNNAMTVGAMKALKELGRKVPADVALVCYDDFEWADLFEPRLTAIEQNVDEMGAKAVDLLIDRIEGNDAPRRILRTPTMYHHRNSCGCPD